MVTGFTDQSKNVQSRVVVIPTPTPGPCVPLEDEISDIGEIPGPALRPGSLCPPGEDEPSADEGVEQPEPAGS
jgi:hypothetical protein